MKRLGIYVKPKKKDKYFKKLYQLLLAPLIKLEEMSFQR